MTRISPYKDTNHENDDSSAVKYQAPLLEDAEQESNQSGNIHLQQKKAPIVCPLRLFLILTISFLIVICSVTIYLSVFIGLYTSIDELSSKVVLNVQDKVITYVDRLLSDLKLMSQVGASHYNYALISKDSYRSYLLQAYNNSGVFVGYFFYHYPTSERYSYNVIDGKVLYANQPDGFPGLIRDYVDISDGHVIKYNFTVDMTPANLSRTAFYTSTIDSANQLGVEGVFGSPFYIINGGINLPYGTKIYNPTLYKLGQKVLDGICRCTIPLYLFSDFLKKITVFTQGYVLLTESQSTMAVSGSIKTTTVDDKSNLSLFNLTEKNAGKLMQDISERYNGLNNLPEKFYITSMGVKYIVSVRPYIFDNVVWRLYVVVFEDDVSLTTNISIGVSIGVAVIIIVISIIYSFFLSSMITRPIIYLKTQFDFIKVFDLENVTLSNSSFKEINEIFSDLGKTVEWLKEIKSFIPDNVFYQIRATGEEEDQEEEHQQETKTLQNQNNVLKVESGTNSNLANDSSSLRPKPSSSSLSSKGQSSNDTASVQGDPRALFKLGLFKKGCSIIFISLPQYDLITPHNDIGITFPKIITAIRSIAKVFQAHLQVNTTEEILLVIESRGSNKKPISVLAMECALKIEKTLQGSNTTLKQQNMKTIKYCIGISTNELSYAGNLGTNQFRFYSVISNSLIVAKNLTRLCFELGLKILVDENTCRGASGMFITRPIDRLLVEGKLFSSSESTICNVCELLRVNSVEDDEWMYELETKNANKQIEQFLSMFNIFNSDTSDEDYGTTLRNQTALLRDYVSEHPTELSYSKILRLFDNLLHGLDQRGILESRKLATQYYTSISTLIRSSVDLK